MTVVQHLIRALAAEYVRGCRVSLEESWENNKDKDDSDLPPNHTDLIQWAYDSLDDGLLEDLRRAVLNLKPRDLK